MHERREYDRENVFSFMTHTPDGRRGMKITVGIDEGIEVGIDVAIDATENAMK